MSEQQALGNQEGVDDNQDKAIDPIVEKAMSMGWKPKDQYDGDPDNWRPAKQFIEYGELVSQTKNLQKQIQGMKKAYNDDITNLNLFHRAELEAREKEIQERLNKAVEDGDKVAAKEAVKDQIQVKEQISKMAAQAPQDDESPEIIKGEWEMNNPWIFDTNDPKTRLANTAYNMALAKKMGIREALEFVDEQIAKKFPERKGLSNPNRLEDPTTVAGKLGTKSSKITMSQVTPAEMKLRDIFPTEEAFLTAVMNSRKGV